jgi:RHS repeat-associated protein
MLGLYEPDHFGNYLSEYIYGLKPDTMGLTGKFFDDSTDLYNVNRRWLESGRGRWMSKDPLGVIDGLNVYAFVHNSPINRADPSGTFSFTIPFCMKRIADEVEQDMMKMVLVSLCIVSYHAELRGNVV